MANETDEQRLLERTHEAVRLTRAGSCDEALNLFEQTIPTLLAGTLIEKRAAAAALSYYGVCLAKVRHRYREAVEYCEVSLKHSLVDPEHRLNLALIYLERDDRSRAVRALKAGLKVQPDHVGIHRLFDQIGRRGSPVLPFLSRDNGVNVVLGKLLRGRRNGHDE